MKKLKLKKPLVFFDLETTGVDAAKDKICQIACTKITVKGDYEHKDVYLNPGMPMPKGAFDIHGISDEFLNDKPKFNQIAKALHKWMDGCDLGGYNSDRFDVVLLAEEFARAGIQWPAEDTIMIDSYKIECMVNSHSLEATYERYMKQEFPDAHNASADVEATMEVFFRQIAKRDMPVDVEELRDFCIKDKEREKVDLAEKLYRKDGVVYYNFGPHKDEPVRDDVGFANWMLDKDFTHNTKQCIVKELAT